MHHPKRFDELKKIWKEKNIIIVEGEQTRLGVRNDLFAGTESIRRIIAPATNSFDKYDEILEKCMELGQGKRTPVPYKYNNEISVGDTVESIDDPDYIQQIVAKFM